MGIIDNRGSRSVFIGIRSKNKEDKSNKLQSAEVTLYPGMHTEPDIEDQFGKESSGMVVTNNTPIEEENKAAPDCLTSGDDFSQENEKSNLTNEQDETPITGLQNEPVNPSLENEILDSSEIIPNDDPETVESLAESDPVSSDDAIPSGLSDTPKGGSVNPEPQDIPGTTMLSDMLREASVWVSWASVEMDTLRKRNLELEAQSSLAIRHDEFQNSEAELNCLKEENRHLAEENSRLNEELTAYQAKIDEYAQRIKWLEAECERQRVTISSQKKDDDERKAILDSYRNALQNGLLRAYARIANILESEIPFDDFKAKVTASLSIIANEYDNQGFNIIYFKPGHRLTPDELSIDAEARIELTDDPDKDQFVKECSRAGCLYERASIRMNQDILPRFTSWQYRGKSEDNAHQKHLYIDDTEKENDNDHRN